MRILFLLITFSSFVHAEYNRESCQGLIDQIDQIHSQQMNLPVSAEEPDGEKLREVLSRRHIAHEQYVLLQEQGNGETERASDFRRIMDAEDTLINSIMSGPNFQRYSRINKYLASLYVQSCSNHQDVTSTDSNLSFQDVNCFANGYRFGVFEEIKEFGSDVMDVISHYMVEAQREDNFPLADIISDCRSLREQSIGLDACTSILADVAPDTGSGSGSEAGSGADRVVAGRGSSTITVSADENVDPVRDNPKEEEVAQTECSRDQEFAYGVCREKCSQIQVRSSTFPHACIDDEAAHRAYNLRRQESKAKWGKIWRTTATVALIGGGALLATWALKSIFSSDDSDYNSGYMAGLSARGSSSVPRGGYYYPTQNRGAGMVPYAIPSQYSGGMGYNGMPAWGGFNPYMNMAQPYSSANDFSNYSFSF